MVTQGGSPNSGAAKKKRKRNKNNQNKQQFIYNNQNQNGFMFNGSLNHLPPLPPPENKPAPPPETAPPLPPGPPPPLPANINVPPPPIITPIDGMAIRAAAEAVKVKPLPNAFHNPTADWPQELTDYVNRCYAKCKTKLDRDQVDIVLKGKITSATAAGELCIRDWRNEPLPSIQSERNNLVPKLVTGHLAQYQNHPTSPMMGGTPPGGNRKSVGPNGLSASLGARLGARSLQQQQQHSLLPHSHRAGSSSSRSRSRSPYGGANNKRRSRSDSRSPVARKRKSSSSSSSSKESYLSVQKQSAKKNKGKLSDRLGNKGLGNKASKNQSKKQKQREKKIMAQSHFYSEFGADFKGDNENNQLLEQRAARFNKGSGGGGGGNKKPVMIESTVHVMGKKKPSLNFSFSIGEDTTGDFDWTEFHVVGTCQEMEKNFLRLTKAPSPSEIRPVAVLRQSLQHVKGRWSEKQDYYYACDQLKSIRQDLTVQGVRNELTVEVYETHARIALEKGDHEEFNQCQTQLKMLYSEVGGPNRNEFTAYRILYYIFTKNTLDIMTVMKSLSQSEKADECIGFTLKLRSAWSSGNFHRFFKLYLDAPLMTAYLVDWFIERERKEYLKCIIKRYVSFRQHIFVFS